jgi:glutamine amidotransferase
LGAQVVVTSQPEIIAQADKVVLPGVGAFGDCMRNLEQYGLVDVIHTVINQGTPFLGICLGLQLLFEGSEEAPGVKGLGIFPGMIRKIIAPGLKIPQMGWNSLELHSASPLFANVSSPAYVYFVHSYHAVPEEASLITAVTDYGAAVTAAVGRGNVQAVQFHPEKSSNVGMAILANFIEVTA